MVASHMNEEIQSLKENQTHELGGFSFKENQTHGLGDFQKKKLH